MSRNYSTDISAKNIIEALLVMSINKQVDANNRILFTHEKERGICICICICQYGKISSWKKQGAEQNTCIILLVWKKDTYTHTVYTHTHAHVYIHTYACAYLGFPWWLGGKEAASQAGDIVSIPRLEWSPGDRNGNPLQYSCLGWGCKRVRHNLATK